MHSPTARPLDIPAAPAGVYAQCGWLSWGDWLGTGTMAAGQRTDRPFTEARADVRARGLRNCDDWKVWSRTAARPPDIPTHPHVVYKDDGWVTVVSGR